MEKKMTKTEYFLSAGPNPTIAFMVKSELQKEGHVFVSLSADSNDYWRYLSCDLHLSVNDFAEAEKLAERLAKAIAGAIREPEVPGGAEDQG